MADSDDEHDRYPSGRRCFGAPNDYQSGGDCDDEPAGPNCPTETVETGDEYTDDDTGGDQRYCLWKHVYASFEEGGVSDGNEVERSVIEASVELDMSVKSVRRRKILYSPVNLG